MDNRPVAYFNVANLVGFVLLSGVLTFGIFSFNADKRNAAIDACAQVSRVENVATDGQSKVSYPLENVFNECLSKKGIK